VQVESLNLTTSDEFVGWARCPAPTGIATAGNATSEIARLSRALKSPPICDSAAALAHRTRAEGWDHEQYLARVLEEEVLGQGDLRLPAAGQGVWLPAVKTLDDVDFDFQRSVRSSRRPDSDQGPGPGR